MTKVGAFSRNDFFTRDTPSNLAKLPELVGKLRAHQHRITGR